MDLHKVLEKVADLIPLENDPQWHPLRRAIVKHCSELEAKVRELEAARLADAELANKMEHERCKRIAELEAVQAKLAARCFRATVQFSHSAEIELKGANELIARVRRECGLDKE